MLVIRSVDYWNELGVIVRVRFAGDELAQIHIITIVQLLWDRADPGMNDRSPSPHVTRDRSSTDSLSLSSRATNFDVLTGGYMNYIRGGLPNTPSHEVLLHDALGDAQVTYVGAYMIARASGAKIFESNVAEPNEQNFYDLPSIPDDSLGRGAHLVTWQFEGVGPAPEWNVPANEKTDTHDGPRMQLDSQQMMFMFFSTGDVVNTCEGACQVRDMYHLCIISRCRFSLRFAVLIRPGNRRTPDADQPTPVCIRFVAESSSIKKCRASNDMLLSNTACFCVSLFHFICIRLCFVFFVVASSPADHSIHTTGFVFASTIVWASPKRSQRQSGLFAGCCIAG